MAKQETTAEFGNRMWSTLEQGFVSCCISLGSQLGIFDELAKATTPLTSQELADRLSFKERYVREWLGSMACSRIVEVKDEKFWLPEHRRAVMAGMNPMNKANFSWAIPMCAQVSDDLKECFKIDGPRGMPYSKFPVFHDWREYRMKSTYTWESLKLIVGQIPGLIQKLEQGTEMCELGCSTGHLSFILAEQFPNSTIYGYDISEEAIDFANKKAHDLGIKNVKFAVQDCCNMPGDWTGKWDYSLAYDLVHDVPKTTEVLREISRVMKPGCAASIVDINMHTKIGDNVGSPIGGYVYCMSLFHCMPVSLDFEGGQGLGAAWGREKAVEMLKEAGFTTVQTLDIPGEYYICNNSQLEGPTTFLHWCI